MSYLTKEEIIKKAYELKISKIGFARADALTNAKLLLREWLSKNYHGDMNWMGSSFEKRVDPRKILQNAKTIIVCALNYYTPYQHEENDNVGKISRYAWGDDYHLVFKKLLNKLLHFIKSYNKEIEGKIYVDTGPVMEKVWAQNSGIGWIGKHTNLISREFGSWIFLGVIIVNIEFENDVSHTDLCGSCTKCIDACPTNAIVEQYVLDSRKCISYLTIEHKSEIESTLAEKFKNWIYGCDICQDVCPWNKKFAQITKFLEFYPRDLNLNPNLFDLKNISYEDFLINYKNSAIKRIKHKKFIENIEIVFKKRK